MHTVLIVGLIWLALLVVLLTLWVRFATRLRRREAMLRALQRAPVLSLEDQARIARGQW